MKPPAHTHTRAYSAVPAGKSLTAKLTREGRRARPRRVEADQEERTEREASSPTGLPPGAAFDARHLRLAWQFLRILWNSRPQILRIRSLAGLALPERERLSISTFSVSEWLRTFSCSPPLELGDLVVKVSDATKLGKRCEEC